MRGVSPRSAPSRRRPPRRSTRGPSVHREERLGRGSTHITTRTPRPSSPTANARCAPAWPKAAPTPRSSPDSSSPLGRNRWPPLGTAAHVAPRKPLAGIDLVLGSRSCAASTSITAGPPAGSGPSGCDDARRRCAHSPPDDAHASTIVGAARGDHGRTAHAPRGDRRSGWAVKGRGGAFASEPARSRVGASTRAPWRDCQRGRR
jgi:hypothetical protein